MNTLQIISAVISVFTTATAIIGMQCKSMRYVIISQLVVNVLLGLQYALEGAWGAAISVPFAIALSMISLIYNLKERRIPLLIVGAFLAVFGFIIFYGYTGAADILAFAALCSCVFSITAKCSAAARVFTLFNCLFWLVYDVFRAPTAILTHSVVLVFTLIGVIRLDRELYKSLTARLFGKVGRGK